MKKIQYDEHGLDNLAAGIVERAREDFIIGYCLLKSRYGYIPTERQFIARSNRVSRKNRSKAFGSNWTSMMEYYNVIHWIEKDPWGIFGWLGVSKDRTVELWTEMAEAKYAEKQLKVVEDQK